MSTTTGRGPGRPPKQNPETAQKGREYLELVTKFDVPVGKIAERENVSPTWVFELIKKARAEAMAEAPDLGAPTPGKVQKAAPPRRLSRRIAQSRAWDYADRRPSFALGLAANNFWVRIVIATHEDGDGFRLRIGEEGSRFRARADLAILLLGHLDRQDVHVDDWLKALFEHGRLVDLGVDIGIPSGLGLVPGENSRGEPLKLRAPAKQSASAQAPLPFRPTLVSGGRVDSSEIPPPDSTNIPISLESDSSEIANFDSTNIPISVESAELARTATAAANAKESQSLSSSSSTGSPAPATQVKFGISVESDSSEIHPRDSSDINPERPPLAELTAELVQLARLGRAPNPDDLGCVQAWTAEGETPHQLREAIQIKRTQIGDKAVSGLLYFSGAVKDAQVRRRLPAATAPAKQTAVSEALPAKDQALRDRLRAIKHRFPPMLADFKAGPAHAAIAVRWLDTAEACVRAGLEPALPDFTLAKLSPHTYEDDMLVVTEALKGSDPPEAAD